MKRIVLIALTVLLPGCSLFLPTGASCSRSLPMYASCAPAASNSHRAFKLADTYWKLVQLEGNAVREIQLLRDAHIRLDGVRQQVSGSGGCNQTTGHYTLTGSDGIRFGELSSTKMACSPGMELEQGFLKSLQQAVRWRIEGDRLQLRDADDATLATFWAVDKP